MHSNTILSLTAREIEQMGDQKLLDVTRTAIREQSKIHDYINYGEPTDSDKALADKLQMKEGELRAELAGRGMVINKDGQLQTRSGQDVA